MRYVASVKVREVLEFACKSCRYETSAVVSGKGHGEARLFFDKSAAVERAHTKAEASAHDDVLATFRFASCPSCHRRDDAAIAGARVWAVVVATLIGAVLAGGLGLIGAGRDRPLPMWMVVAAGGVAAALVYWMKRARWTTADERVAFPAYRGQPERARAVRPAAPPRGAPPRGVETHPFRAPPTISLAVIDPAKAQPTPIVEGDPDVKPQLLL